MPYVALLCAALLMLLCVACTGGESGPPPTFTPETATPTATPAATITPTPLPTPTGVAYLFALESLFIRSAPGIEHIPVGRLYRGCSALLLGQSTDDQWYQIACTVEGYRGQCWVIGDAQYVQIQQDTAGGSASALIGDCEPDIWSADFSWPSVIGSWN